MGLAAQLPVSHSPGPQLVINKVICRQNACSHRDGSNDCDIVPSVKGANAPFLIYLPGNIHSTEATTHGTLDREGMRLNE